MDCHYCGDSSFHYQIFYYLHYLKLMQYVEIACRLIKEKDICLLGKRPCKIYPLLFAPTNLAKIP